MHENYILVINAGSSSVKCSVFDVSACLRYRIVVKGIGLTHVSCVEYVAGESEHETQLPASLTHDDAFGYIRDVLIRKEAGLPRAVGYRVVHGGGKYSAPTPVTDAVLADMRSFTSLAPEHMPLQIATIELCRELYPTAHHIACFDTAFHESLPVLARIVPLPRALAQEGVRRYGFHGISYTSIVAQLAREGVIPERVVVAHLGNGASITALKHGVSVETSMGMTPASGLLMSTRVGDIDPGIITYLHRERGLTSDEIDVLINKQSGLLGVSGLTGDMKQLLALEAEHPHAKDAVDIFCYTVKKYIGAYAAVLDGIDMLVFSGGIGEVAPKIRERICAGLSWMGIVLEQEKNATSAAVLSAEGARVVVRVVHTDEEQVIADACARGITVG